MLSKVLFSLSLTCVVLSASSLNIYSDRSFYTYEPKDTFIGFNTQISAKDSTQTLELVHKHSCESESLSCKEHTKIQDLHVKLNQLTREQSILENIVSQYQPKVVINAQEAIKTANKIASHMAKLQIETAKTENEIKSASTKFSKYALSNEAIYFSKKPESKVTLSINSGLYFKSEYVLNIDKSTLEHNILLTNRSGIDIKADEARLFAKISGRIQAPIQFYPRKIHMQLPRAKRALDADVQMMAMQSAPAPVMARKSNALHVSKTQTRSYHIKNLSLPSDGTQKKIPVDTQNLSLNKTLTWHPYSSNYVYQNVSFTPKQTIESQSWKVLHNRELIQNAPIRRIGKKITLNVAIDYDIETKREKINEFSKDKGIFSSDRLKKEGFKLTLTNRSKVDKKVQITERIPLSTQEEIEVSLEKLHLPYNYNTKTGKLTMTADIKAGKTLNIDVIYVIRYPKETEIYY